MFHGNEEKVMRAPAVRLNGSSCWHKSAHPVSVKKPRSHVRHLPLLLLVVLLAGQASGNHTSTTPSVLSATTQAQSSEHYVVTINVAAGGKKNESEITAWLTRVFQSNLESCVPPNHQNTTTQPTSSQTTPPSTFQTANTTVMSNYNTTTATTPVGSNTTATSAASTTVKNDSATTTAAASTVTKSNSTTLGATTASGINHTTTAATTTAVENATTATTASETTTAVTTTVVENATTATTASETTTAATTTAVENATTATTASETTTTATTTAVENATTATTASETTTAALTTLAKNNTVATTTMASETTTVATTTAVATTTIATSTAVGTTLAATTAVETTTAATSTAVGTTTAATSTVAGTTTAATSTAVETTTAATSTAVGTTTAATTAVETTTAATTTAVGTTTPATSTVVGTTKPATSTAVGTTTAVASTPSQSSHTTTTVVQNSGTASPEQIPTTPQNQVPTFVDSQTFATEVARSDAGSHPSSNSLRRRFAREAQGNDTQTSGVSSDDTTGLFQGIEVDCEETTEAGMICDVMLKLRQNISSCCILQTLCAADQNSSDVQAVGKRAARISQLGNYCIGNPDEQNSCVYDGQAGSSCNESAFVVYQSNTTHCGAGSKNSSCSCSAYCNGTDAYYTFELSINDVQMTASHVSSLISQTTQAPNCSLPSSEGACALCIVLSQYKDAHVTCANTTNLQSAVCRVILRLAQEVPICNVSAAMGDVFQFLSENITFDGQVTRAAICGNSVSNNTLDGEFELFEVNLSPDTFCATIQYNISGCQNGKNVVVPLNEACVLGQSTTVGPNVTSALPNTTSVNITSSPANTTTPAATNSTVAMTTNVTSANNGTTEATSESTTTAESADSQANALLDLARNVSNLNSSQVNQLVSQLENLLSGPNVSLSLGNTSVQIVSSLLGASPEVLSESSNRIIGIVDTVALKLVLEENTETLLSSAVALSVRPADGANFQETSFSIADPNNVLVRRDPRLRRYAERDSSVPQGSIRLPASLTQNLSPEQQQLASRVQFNFYQKSTVFQDKSLGERRLNSGILGASVANLSIAGLQENVEIVLKNTVPVPANFVASCVFWDFALNDGSGGWNSDGCFVRNSTVNETLCSCNHLTSFAILLDIFRQPVTSRLQATILTFITFIGCGISAIFLSITLLTYLAFGKLRKDIPSKILIQLCLALLLLNLVFLVDAWLALYPDAVGLCISTAWFLHYFLLVSFTWMGLEAVHMYLALVKVFNSYISRYMLKFSLVGWGVPMIVVIIVIAIDKDNYGLISYGRFSDGTSDDFCWLKNDVAFYVAVVAYFCIIFVFNLVIFIVVLVQLCRIKRQNPHNVTHRTTLQDARSVAGITILLGLTWGFAFFAWGPLNLPFMYLFAIFNSLQGFFIFVFHCAVKENVRRQWRTYLCCGKMRLAENSEWSRTATQKTMKKSSVTRLTSLQSSESAKSNNSSSSTSFLVSDASDQINGISSPFDDRTITADEETRMDVILNEINRQHRNQ